MSPRAVKGAGRVRGTRVVVVKRLRVLLALLGALIVLGAIYRTAPVRASMGPAPAQYYNIPLFYWPVDGDYRAISTYPDDPWTWDYLGLVDGMSCPGYSKREYEVSLAFWRDPDMPEDQDWRQASRGHRRVACYRNHQGTDIVTPPGAPVYAVSDGTVEGVLPGTTGGFEDATLEIHHQRLFRGQLYEWRARYRHLRNLLPVESGPVRAGQLIGYVAYQKDNTHLHFEVEGLWPDCGEGCVTNPWGPDLLWIDYDSDVIIDPATTALPHAPAAQNIVANPGFENDLAGWNVSTGAAASVQNGVLGLHRLSAGAPGSVQQVIPSIVDAGDPLEMTLRLGNASAVTKYVGVSLRSPRTWQGYVGCVFALPPGAPLESHTVRGVVPATWYNVILQISANPADGLPDVLVDDVSIRLWPETTPAGLECLGPG